MNTSDRTLNGVVWFAAGMATAFALVRAFGPAVATEPREKTARNAQPSGPAPSTDRAAARSRWATLIQDQVLAEFSPPPALVAAAEEDDGHMK